ncbi:MAG: DUF6265 family protein [Ferruginibacter sp.]
MKGSIIAITIILCLSAFYTSDNNKTFKKLYALEGAWKMTTKRGAICEEWKKVDKNYLQSRGYMIKGTDTIVNERVALTNTAAGIFYTSTVEDQNNKQPIAFKMTRAENNMFVFENPEHDFPRRIVYKLIGPDSLHAFIDDGIEGTKKIQNFYYKRQ